MSGDDASIASRLAASLPTKRWFADKAAGVAGVTIRERVPLPQAAAELILADVHQAVMSPGGRQPPRRYVVMIDPAGDDAADTPACGGWLLDLVLSARVVIGQGGRLIGHRITDGRGPTSLPPVGPITVGAVGGDASNTSLVVRSATASWVVKLFRRCRPGICPEVEVGEFFSTHSPWPDTPRLCGWLEYVPDVDRGDDTAAAVATVHEFMPGRTTGWERLVDLLIAGRGLQGGAADAVVDIVAALGRVTARMHMAFAARPDIQAFAPATVSPAGLETAAERMREHAERVFASIESHLTGLPTSIARRLAAVLDARSTLTRVCEQLPHLGQAAATIRVHGDYHLGQVLVAEHDSQPLPAERATQPLVIDFEGEPGRSLAERREKTFAAKDVAGMCRSFDYLLRHVAKSTGIPCAAADLQRLESCYLDAYRRDVAGAPWWPADRSAADELVGVFKLDKAIYELAYELDNRPDWIDVPLAAIEEAIAGHPFVP